MDVFPFVSATDAAEMIVPRARGRARARRRAGLWMGVLVLMVLVVSLVASLLGSPGLAGDLLFPVLMLMASMFFTSLYFTFRDSFDAPPQEEA